MKATAQCPLILILLGLDICLLACTVNSPSDVVSGPMIVADQNGKVLDGLRISSTEGDCLTVINSTNITIRNSEIGPCSGNGIRIIGSSNIKVYDSYIHPEAPPSPCCDKGDGILAEDTVNLHIQGNVIAYGEANIMVSHAATVRVIGNFLLNPQNTSTGSRGHNFQSWNGSQDILVENNYTLSSLDATKYKFAERQEDSINFGLTADIVARGNYIRGGHSPSGCGLIADKDAEHAHFVNNTLIDTGQCGIGISDGKNHVVEGNRVLNSTPVIGGGNTAIYVWRGYDPPCGPVTIANNVASQLKPDGTESGFWNGGGCDPVILLNNIFGSKARSDLTPVDQLLRPPLIPPEPYACPAASPYTNRVGCRASSAH